MSVAEVPMWQLVEALSFIAILKNADSIRGEQIAVIFGRTGPVEIIEDGAVRFVWTQQNISAVESELGARPDIVVTVTERFKTGQV